MNRLVVVFSGYNQRAVVAFLRTMTLHSVRFAIVASSKSDPIIGTEYGKKVFAIRKSEKLELEDITKSLSVVRERTQCNEVFLAPSTEALNRFLLQNRAKFSEMACIIPLPSEEIYTGISDKYKFNDLCERSGILIPSVFDAHTSLDLPFVAKPKTYAVTKSSVALRPLLIYTANERREFLDNYNINNYYCQEYVSGESYYLLYYFYKDGSVARFSQVNFLQQHDGKSIVAAQSSLFHHTIETKKYEALFNSLRYRGLVMVEIRRRQGKNYMIEANPRFWGPSQLFVDSNVNLFSAFLYDWGYIKEKPVMKDPPRSIKYFWLGGIIETVINHASITFHRYPAENLAEDFPEWIRADVYNREDTRKVFLNEAGITK